MDAQRTQDPNLTSDAPYATLGIEAKIALVSTLKSLAISNNLQVNYGTR